MGHSGAQEIAGMARSGMRGMAWHGISNQVIKEGWEGNRRHPRGLGKFIISQKKSLPPLLHHTLQQKNN